MAFPEKVICEFWTPCLREKFECCSSSCAVLLQSTYHPADPQAGLTGCAHSHTAWRNVWRCLESLDDARRLAERTLPDHIHLPHPEPEGHREEQTESVQEDLEEPRRVENRTSGNPSSSN